MVVFHTSASPSAATSVLSGVSVPSGLSGLPGLSGVLSPGTDSRTFPLRDTETRSAPGLAYREGERDLVLVPSWFSLI